MWTLAKAHLHRRRLVVPLGHKRDLHSAGSIAVAGTWTPLGPTRSVTWMPHREDEGRKYGIHILDAGNENARAAAGPAARTLGAQSWRDPHHRVRAHAGDVPRRAQSDHRRHCPADHRARFSRFRTPAVDRYSIPAEFDRGRAAVRKAQRHLRATRHDAREHRYLRGRLRRLCRSARHDHAHPRPWSAGDWRRRYSPIGASDSCRRGRAPRARPLPGLYGKRLGYRGARRSSRRRHSDRALPLVNHLLVQCSVGAGCSHHGAQEPQGPAAPRPQAQARPARRRPDGGLGNPAAAGAHLGRVALSLAFRTHWSWPQPYSRSCSSGG
jgi:hypothetical protein